MKLHKTLATAVIQTVQRIFTEDVYADKAVEQVLKQNTRWGSRDRRFIAETIYGIVRWWRLLAKSAGIEEVQVTADLWKIFAAAQIIKGNGLPDWEEFAGINKKEIEFNYSEAQKVRKYRESIPDWLDELGVAELGAAVWENELPELNKEAKVVLRVNTLKTDVAKLQRLLAEQSIETTADKAYKDALMLAKRQNLHLLNEYRQGLFEVQDASSQLIAPFVDLQPGLTVIDACAGAGGKSLHMAAMMKDSGKIISMDVEERKLLELKRRADRAGVKSIQTCLVNSQALEQLKNSADRLLLDVPCSGLGVIRRNPDAKWKLGPAFIQEIKKAQQAIITNYSQMVKPGGIMVYATCSILPSENQLQVEKFLNDHAGFEFIKDRKVLPSEGFDGFYMAAVKRKA